MSTRRLDILLVERGLAKSREHAQALILSGEVWTGERRLEKPGTPVSAELPIEVRGRGLPFVSRAGMKLQHALDAFGLDVRDRTCLDIGASTGGFTDCLLQRGARHVFSVDVGYGQLDMKLRKDARVTVVEECNARYLSRDQLLERNPSAAEISFVCMDVSFISLSKLIPVLSSQFPAKDWVCLFKPQFEVGRENIGKGGRVRSPEAAQSSLAEFSKQLASLGLLLGHGPEISPLAGKKSGNLEYLVHYELSTTK